MNVARAGRLLLVLVIVSCVVGMAVTVVNPKLGLWLCAPACLGAALVLLAVIVVYLGEAIHWAWTGTSWLNADEPSEHRC